ncbi:unnamed protein product [Musa textilis]
MLPLPSPPAITVLKNLGSFKSSNGGGPIVKSGSLPFPQLGGELRKFSYDEISAALPFSVDHRISEGISSTVYKATLEDGILGSKKIEAAVTQLRHSLQGLKEFVYEVNVLVSLQHPNLCKLLGFHAQEGFDERMLIFERLYHGNLDPLLHGSSDGPSIDWCARVKVVYCAARGLSFLHEECPFQLSLTLAYHLSNLRLPKLKCVSWTFLFTSRSFKNYSVTDLRR